MSRKMKAFLASVFALSLGLSVSAFAKSSKSSETVVAQNFIFDEEIEVEQITVNA